MENTAELVDIKARLARLRALADQPGTDGEAEAARSAITRLLFRYNLSQADIPDIESNEAPFISQATEEVSGGNTAWQGILLSVLGRFHFVGIAQHHCTRGFGTKSATWELIGREHNVQAVTALYDSIVRELHQQAESALKNKPVGYHGRAYRRTFLLGAVNRIKERFEEQRRNDLAGIDNSTALVSQVQNEVEAAIAARYPKLSKGSAIRINHNTGNAYATGRVAGNSVKIQGGFSASHRALTGRAALTA